ncbi:MAG: carboxypeptidase regulatory-like domain-containing protein [Candidatus Heimdallarchaeota archaeon]|nr:carboxypeptidase regulatory-like domain-containing protein [Candidatus Heimdallarchaeota archaeon]MCG3254825.1 carboxypeptidase regulatory-like domain-containing protein [Candidatus Heimdallarchaeota archaeon]MCK4609902.1 carboxypeptidase regulatory-like domain-containing protein [Candidatus Heimdallarchaeota archaeon]
MKLSKNKKITLLIIFSLGIIALTQTPQTYAFFGGKVSGKVTYNGSGLSNALVTLLIDGNVEDTYYTSSTGFYSVRTDDLLRDTIPVEIKVEKNGYTTIYRETYLYPWVPTTLNIEYLVNLRCKGYVYDHTGTALSSATVKLIKVSGGAVLKTVTTNSNGYYDFTKSVMENLHCKLQVSKTGYETKFIELYASGQTTTANFYIALTSAERIAAFFVCTTAAQFGSDYETSPYVDGYISQLISEEGFDDYREYYDEADWEDAIAEIDTLEDEDTFVFIYIFAHGRSYGPTTQHTIVEIAPDVDMYSEDFAVEIAKLESNNIMLLAEACMSEGFVNDLEGTGVFVISTAKLDQFAYMEWYEDGYDPDGPPHESYFPGMEGIFSRFFFESIHLCNSDYTAFLYARNSAIDYYWDYIDGNPGDMGGPPVAQCSDQCVYTWFETW